MAHRITIQLEDVGQDTCVRAEESYIDIHGDEQWHTMTSWGSPLCMYCETREDVEHALNILGQRITIRQIHEQSSSPVIIGTPA